MSQAIHGAGGIGGLLAVEETSATGSPQYWFFYDGNGNVGQAIKSSDYSIAAKYEYDPYGGLITKSGDYANANPMRFSTKWFDDELAGDRDSQSEALARLFCWNTDSPASNAATASRSDSACSA